MGAALVLCVCPPRAGGAQEQGPLAGSLPERMGKWEARAPDRFFDPVTLFEHINGAAGVYRAYNVRGCVSRRYENPKGPAVVLDIFHMASSQDAFGVLTHDLDAEPTRIGQGGLYRFGWLRFWKDRMLATVLEADTRALAEDLLARVKGALVRGVRGSFHPPNPLRGKEAIPCATIHRHNP